MSEPSVPYTPRSFEEHRARWAKAIEPVFDILNMTLPYIPSTNPDHIFDFRCGLRLCVSRDRYAGKDYIHVSGSAFPQSETWNNLANGQMNKTGFHQLVIDNVVGIGSTIVTFGFYSDGKGVPHYFNPPLPKELTDE